MEAADTNYLVREAADLLRVDGRAAVADQLLESLRRPRPSRPTVIVAGEDKRGKSSLVNALLARPGLSPIGVEVVTGSPISFVHAPAPRASVLHYGQDDPVETAFEEARRLATIEGNPGNEFNIRSVELGIDHPLLTDLVLVDSPGVGGLYSGHAELTLQSLALADALVFVLDSAAQIRAAELDFLKRASARIETVILVLTKTDLHRGWRTILDDDRRILAEQAPRFSDAPFLPVSSALALRAEDMDDPEEVAAIRDESGISALQSMLAQGVVARSATLYEANRLRAAVGPLAVAQRSARQKLAAVTGSSGGQAGLQQEQARLRQLQSERSEWPRRLDTEIRRITLSRSEAASLGLAEVRRRYEGRLRDISKTDMESLPGELIADLTALAGRLNEETAARLSGLVTSLLADVEPSPDVEQALARLTGDRLSDRLEQPDLGQRKLDNFDRMSLLVSFSSGRALTGLVSGGAFGVTTGLAVVPPLGIVLGLGLGALFAYQAFRGKKKTAFAAEFRSWMAEQCAATQTTLNMTFQRELIDVQDEIRRMVSGRIAEREEEIQEALRAAREAQAAQAEQRARMRAGLEGRVRSYTDLLQRINRTLASARSLPGAPAPTA